MNILFFDDGALDPNIVLHLAHELAEPLLEREELQNETPRNKNYFEITVPQYSDEQFKSHFRMIRNTFQDLCELVASQMAIRKPPKIEIEKKVLLFLYVLCYQVSYNNAGDKFDMSGSTAYHIFQEIVTILSHPRIICQYIKWPEETQYEHIANVFCTRSKGFPGVIGIIDGCHIPIRQPIGNAQDFYNRHENHSIILQGVCDHHLKFIDIFVGMPGRMHDARVFRNSPLFTKLNNVLSQNYHLLGDSAYPLSPAMMTPYRDNGHLNDTQINYNVKLSSIRSTIERVFGFLKGKFRRLKYLDVEKPELANKIVTAACVLHNFLIEHGEIEIEEDMQPLRNGYIRENINEAQAKQNYIAGLIL